MTDLKDIKMKQTNSDYHDISFDGGGILFSTGDDVISAAIEKMLWSYPLKNGYGVGIPWMRGEKISPALAMTIRERILRSLTVVEKTYSTQIPLNSFSLYQEGDRLNVKLDIGGSNG
jgi:hypothetical protein